MKRILMGSLVLVIFSLAVAIFQMSCRKSAMAQTTTTTGLAQLNLILYTIISNPHTANPTVELWLSNLDGSSPHSIPLTLPAGLSFDGSSRLSPDGKTIVLELKDSATPNPDFYIYTCAIDGSNFKKVVDGSPTVTPQLNGVY